MNYLYKGTFNWYGELHTLHTVAKCENKAFQNFVTRLAKLLSRSRRSVLLYYVDEMKDNYKITVVGRR